MSVSWRLEAECNSFSFLHGDGLFLAPAPPWCPAPIRSPVLGGPLPAFGTLSPQPNSRTLAMPTQERARNPRSWRTGHSNSFMNLNTRTRKIPVTSIQMRQQTPSHPVLFAGVNVASIYATCRIVLLHFVVVCLTVCSVFAQPAAPTLNSPGSSSSPGTTISTLTPTMSWNASIGAINYGGYIYDVTSSTLVYNFDYVGNTLSLALPSGYLVAGHSYRWNVFASNNDGFSDFSGLLYFQEQSAVTVPSAPTLNSPGSSSSPGTTISTLTPTMSWNAASGATNYGVYIYDVTTSTLVYNIDYVGNTLSLALPSGYLVAGHSYRWNMRASNDAGFSAFSALLYFQAAVQTNIGFYMSFPLAGQTPLTASINSVFDHSMSSSYTIDNVVVAFDGERGERGFGWDGSSSPGYKNSAGTNFWINGQYTGAGELNYLNYDGHPGIDYRAARGTAVYAAADGFAHYPASFPGVNNGATFHALAIDHTNGFISYYLHVTNYPTLGNALVAEGQFVHRGDWIASASDAGVPGSPHLHFEVQLNGVPVDPYGWTGTGTDPYTTAVNVNLWTTGGGSGGASPPTISNARLTGTSFTLTTSTQVGFNYILEYKTSLNDANWIPVQTNSGSGAQIDLTNIGVTGPSRIYHIRVQ